jgi:hypothetical protein
MAAGNTEHLAPDMTPLWQDRPSLFLYAGTYIVIGVVIYLAWQMMYALSYSPIELMVYGQWARHWTQWSFNDWPQFAVVGCALLIVIVFLHGFSKFCQCLYTRYSVVNEQLVVRRFLMLGTVEYRVEMYRIVDFMQVQMANGGLFGYSTIRLRSTDANQPYIILEGVRKASTVIELLRNETERCRQKKGIQEMVSPQMLNNQIPLKRR